MESAHGMLGERNRLAGVVRDVRTRWRLKRVLHGATITLVVGFVILAVAAWVMTAVRYAPVPVLVTRLVALASVIAVTVRYLILPLRRNPGDAEVALYLEEHEPSLDGALMTAVDVGNRGTGAGSSTLSPALATRLLRSALDRVRTVDDGRRVDACRPDPHRRASSRRFSPRRCSRCWWARPRSATAWACRSRRGAPRAPPACSPSSSRRATRPWPKVAISW